MLVSNYLSQGEGEVDELPVAATPLLISSGEQVLDNGALCLEISIMDDHFVYSIRESWVQVTLETVNRC